MKSNITEILEEYESLRLRNENLQRQRIEEVYTRLPVIRDIDSKISSIGFEIASSIFKLSKEGIDAEEFISNKRKEIESLKQEKAVILTENGFAHDYMDINYKCSKCKDTGYVDAKKCNCFKQKLINLYYKQSNLTNVLQRENFTTFKMDYYSTVKSETYGVSPRDNIMEISARCVDFCETFDNNNTNLLFTGSTGLGKTFLCNCIAMEVLKKGKSVVYNTSSTLIDNIRNIKYSDTDKSKLDYTLNCDLLIIDDLGTENITQSSQSEIFNIINERILRRKKTIISTNLSLDELQVKYHQRIVSRIFGNFDIFEFFGQDIRIIINSHKVKKR
ncbi:ATP-binding protein [Clostridium cylindrosporum]|uniref:DNA replication protein DnaC n=1 Tax=Clostridium cylindrosporum DSM 605 TaxID=1121307 RepID=A0A0J8DC79_CLOCY|nr:ATP-binding protein [Clostridium cylindrosporum]KMT21863.1 DNA replication protein DnaC [Clostridium cylindrosporum DSM 605]